MKVFYSRLADRDLAEIGEWIAADNPRAAARTIDRLLTACEALSHLALRYPVVRGGALRKRPMDDYVIFYRVTDQVEVIRILHSARDWLALLDET